MKMTAEDWQEFQKLLDKQREGFKEDTKLICENKIHDAMDKHTDKAWTHNPVRAVGLFGGIIAAIEGIRKLFSGH